MLFHQNIQSSNSKPGISIPLGVCERFIGCTPLFCFITIGYKLGTIIDKKVRKRGTLREYEKVETRWSKVIQINLKLGTLLYLWLTPTPFKTLRSTLVSLGCIDSELLMLLWRSTGLWSRASKPPAASPSLSFCSSLVSNLSNSISQMDGQTDAR